MTYYYKEFVLGFSAVVYVFEQYLSYRQHKQLTNVRSRTETLKPLLSAEDFRKTRLYALDKSSFGFVQAFFSFLFNSALIYYDALPWFWSKSGNLLLNFLTTYWGLSNESVQVEHYEISQSLLFLTALTLVNTVFSIPFSVYSTFVIEEKHGFNKQTFGLFLSDLVKSLFLSAVIGLPLIAGFLWVVRATGEQFYLYVWLFLVAVQFIMITIYPILIQPLFNKVEPLPDGPLKEKIEALAARCAFPLTKLYVIDGSRRSSHSNAYFYGFFKNKRIVLFDTLLEQMDTHEEILAVLGHEIGHWAYSHTLRVLAFSQLHLFALFYLFSKFTTDVSLFESFGFARPSVHFPTVISFMLFTFLYAPMESVLGFLMNCVSRYHEFQADEYANALGYAQELRSSLIKLSVKNKGMMWPDWMYAAYHYSHPPVVERLARLESFEVETLTEKPAARRSSRSRSSSPRRAKTSEEKYQTEEGQEDDPLTAAERKEKYLFEQVLRKRA